MKILINEPMTGTGTVAFLTWDSMEQHLEQAAGVISSERICQVEVSPEGLRLMIEKRENLVCEIACGHGFIAVPRDAVCLNELYISGMNTGGDDYAGPYAVIAPNGRALLDEDGQAPYVYGSLDECQRDAENCKDDPYHQGTKS